MAYNQGDDLFAYEDSRLLSGVEYAAKYNAGFDVPYTTYTNSDVTQTVISNNSRGDIRPMWELLYAHYADLKGENATYTEMMRRIVNAEFSGAEGQGVDPAGAEATEDGGQRETTQHTRARDLPSSVSRWSPTTTGSRATSSRGSARGAAP